MNSLTPVAGQGVAAAERTLAADAHRGERRPLPADWRDDPVKVLIAMVLADPTPAGAAVALGWFYGRGLPDPAGPPGTAPLDVGALVLEVLARAADSAGLDAVRRQFNAAFDGPEDPRSDGGGG